MAPWACTHAMPQLVFSCASAVGHPRNALWLHRCSNMHHVYNNTQLHQIPAAAAYFFTLQSLAASCCTLVSQGILPAVHRPALHICILSTHSSLSVQHAILIFDLSSTYSINCIIRTCCCAGARAHSLGGAAQDNVGGGAAAGAAGTVQR
jgi:hypothetical protein